MLNGAVITDTEMLEKCMHGLRWIPLTLNWGKLIVYTVIESPASDQAVLYIQ